MKEIYNEYEKFTMRLNALEDLSFTLMHAMKNCFNECTESYSLLTPLEEMYQKTHEICLDAAELSVKILMKSQ